MNPRGLVAAGALLLPVLVVGAAPAQALESDYGTRATVHFGADEHAQMPVELDVPLPASGGAITSVIAEWKQLTPQAPLEPNPAYTTGTRRLDVSGCTADAECTVNDVLPTARMDNGTAQVTFVVANASGLVGFINRTVPLHNPKPTVSFTSPKAGDALWGDVTISADAAPSMDPGAAAPLKGVRFYVDGNPAADASYDFDATPPYSITLPATDIAPVLGSRYLVVVAEDIDGNLSLMPPAADAATARRRVTVGPPPQVAWTSSRPGGTITGSMRRGVSLEFDAALPDSAPAKPGGINDPFIDSYTVTLDGTPVGTTRYGQPGWNGGPGGQKLRAINGWRTLTDADGLTPGRHTVTVQVHTSYGGVATLTSDILIADGISWGPVTTAGHVVHDGYVVTAGSLHRFTAPVVARVTGTRIDWLDVQAANQNLYMQGWPCASADPPTCPASTVVGSDVWAAPDKPGTALVTFTAQASGDLPDTITRTLTVQPAARLTLDVSRHLVRRGRTVSLTGRLTRADNGAAQVHRTVWVQWRRPNNLHWQRLAIRTTDTTGVVHYRAKPTADGYFRLRSPESRGRLGTGTSTEERVSLTR